VTEEFTPRTIGAKYYDFSNKPTRLLPSSGRMAVVARRGGTIAAPSKCGAHRGQRGRGSVRW